MADEITETPAPAGTEAPAGAPATAAVSSPAAGDSPPEAVAGSSGETPQAEAKPADAPAEPVDYAKAMAEALPKGMEIDPAASKAGSELFAKHKLSAEAAKDLVALYAQQQKAGADGQAKLWAEAVGKWKAESEKTFSKEAIDGARAAARSLFDTKTAEYLERVGAFDHPGALAGFAKIGPQAQDDKLVNGGAASANGTPDYRKQFPNSPNMVP